MKLITEEITDNVEFIVESKSGKKQLYIEGVFLQANIKNRNGRLYPIETLRKEVSDSMFDVEPYNPKSEVETETEVETGPTEEPEE